MNNAVRPDYCTNENHISASPAAFNIGVQIYFPPCEVNLDLFSFARFKLRERAKIWICSICVVRNSNYYFILCRFENTWISRISVIKIQTILYIGMHQMLTISTAMRVGHIIQEKRKLLVRTWVLTHFWVVLFTNRLWMYHSHFRHFARCDGISRHSHVSADFTTLALFLDN